MISVGLEIEERGADYRLIVARSNIVITEKKARSPEFTHCEESARQEIVPRGLMVR